MSISSLVDLGSSKLSTGLLFLLCVVIKDSFKLSDGMKELLGKHYIYYNTAHLWLLYNGDLFDEKPTDIFIDTFGRSGTMTTANIIHNLRTKGKDRPRDIGEMGCFYVPVVGQGLEELNRYQIGSPPRLFWTHGLPDQLPSGVKYVYAVRDPANSTWSWYHFVRQFYNLRNVPTFTEFFWHCLMYNCHWPEHLLWNHFQAWWERAHIDLKKPTENNKNDVLWLHYEHLTSTDPATRFRSILRLSRFIGSNETDHRSLATTLWRSSRQFFIQYPHYFDHSWSINSAVNINQYVSRIAALELEPAEAVDSVMEGLTSSNPKLWTPTDDDKAVFNYIATGWREKFHDLTGSESYAKLLTTNTHLIVESQTFNLEPNLLEMIMKEYNELIAKNKHRTSNELEESFEETQTLVLHKPE